MSTFGDSQVRNFIVGATGTSSALFAADPLTDIADNEVALVSKTGGPVVAGEPFYVAAVHNGKLQKSALIDPKHVVKAGAKSLVVKEMDHTVTLTGTPVAGESIELVVYIDNYGASLGDEAHSVRGGYVIQAGDDVGAVAAGLKGNIDKALLRQQISSIEVAVAGGVITVTFKRTDFKLGKFDGKIVKGRVQLNLFDSGVSASLVSAPGNTVANGIELANLEWFAAGNTGDIYRGISYPNNFDTPYYVNPAVAYDLYEIVHYSERTLAPGDKQRQVVTIAAPTGQLAGIITDAGTLGI